MEIEITFIFFWIPRPTDIMEIEILNIIDLWKVELDHIILSQVFCEKKWIRSKSSSKLVKVFWADL